MAYTDALAVQRLTGLSLTAGQIQLVTDVLAGAATDYVKARTGRDFEVTAVASEAHYAPGPLLYLRQAPVASVSSVVARTTLTGAATTLVAGTDYELRDLTAGLLYLPALAGGVYRPGYYDRVLVSYTPTAAIPDRARLAATMLAAHWLQQATRGVTHGLRSYNVAGELSVTYQEASAQWGVPAEVRALLQINPRLVIA